MIRPAAGAQNSADSGHIAAEYNMAGDNSRMRKGKMQTEKYNYREENYNDKE